MWRQTVDAAMVALCLLSVSGVGTAAEKKQKKSGVSETKPDSTGHDDEIPSVSVKLNKRWRFKMPSDVALGAGYLSGDGIQTDAGPVFELRVGILPHFAYKKRKLKLGLSVDFDERETVGYPLAQRHLRGGPFVEFRPKKKYTLNVSGEAGYMFRPDWPDAYQPELDGQGERTGVLLPTDRFSYFHAEGAADFKVQFIKKLSGNVYAEYLYHDNAEDPNYDSVDDPNHLVPGDRARLRGGLGIAGYVGNRVWRYTVDFRTDWIRYFNTYARDAGTGLTHAAPGGEPANPLQKYVQIRVRERNSFKIYKSMVKLILAGDYTRNIDVFEGYYTWSQVAGDGGLRVSPVRRLDLSLDYSVQYRRYTKNGYQAASNHPPLDNGDTIRSVITHGIKGGVEIGIVFDELKLFAEGEWSRDNTNFPDYEPGIFPESAAYRINWDAVNYRILGGIRVSL